MLRLTSGVVRMTNKQMKVVTTQEVEYMRTMGKRLPWSASESAQLPRQRECRRTLYRRDERDDAERQLYEALEEEHRLEPGKFGGILEQGVVFCAKQNCDRLWVSITHHLIQRGKRKYRFDDRMSGTGFPQKTTPESLFSRKVDSACYESRIYDCVPTRTVAKMCATRNRI